VPAFFVPRQDGPSAEDDRLGDSLEIDERPGYAVYTHKMLRFYDILVHRVSNAVFWRCPTQRLVALYDRHMAAVHLDIGPGTGFFLAKTARRRSVPPPAVTLLDRNPACLAASAARIPELAPVRVEASAFGPWPDDIGLFQSIGLNYLLHCLPGAMPAKAAVFEQAVRHLAPDGVVFGSTIVQGDDGAPPNLGARRLMAFYNKKGVFSNTEDTEATLLAALDARFAQVVTDRQGCVVLFAARTPRG